MRNTNKPLSEILTTRTSIIELVVVGFLIAFGTNILVSSIIEFNFFDHEKFIYIGLGIVITSLLYLTTKLFKNRNFFKKIEGSIVYDIKTDKLLEIPRYRYSEQLSNYLKYSFNENKDIKALWEKNKLIDIYNDEDIEPSEFSSVKLIQQATEYYILRQLSTHLTDYFNKNNKCKNDINTISRENISEIIVKNKFLDLFSKSMNERSGFLEAIDDYSNNDVIISSVNGHLFEKFELKLPKNSWITKGDDSSLLIKNKRFSLRIKVLFDGMTSLDIPSSYIKYILGTNILDYRQFKIKVIIDVKFNILTYISILGWEYYSWIDSLLEKLEKDISSSLFTEKIGWEKNQIVIEYINNLSQKNQDGTKGNEDLNLKVIDGTPNEFFVFYANVEHYKYGKIWDELSNGDYPTKYLATELAEKSIKNLIEYKALGKLNHVNVLGLYYKGDNSRKSYKIKINDIYYENDIVRFTFEKIKVMNVESNVVIEKLGKEYSYRNEQPQLVVKVDGNINDLLENCVNKKAKKSYNISAN